MGQRIHGGRLSDSDFCCAALRPQELPRLRGIVQSVRNRGAEQNVADGVGDAGEDVADLAELLAVAISEIIMDAPSPARAPAWAKAVNALNAYLAFWEIIAQPHMPAARPVSAAPFDTALRLNGNKAGFQTLAGLVPVAGSVRQLFSTGRALERDLLIIRS